VRRLVESHVRSAGPRGRECTRRHLRVQPAGIQLGSVGHGPARAAPGRRPELRLLPHLVRRLSRRRQPGAHACGFRRILSDGSDR
jgi:hypothetical protein